MIITFDRDNENSSYINNYANSVANEVMNIFTINSNVNAAYFNSCNLQPDFLLYYRYHKMNPYSSFTLNSTWMPKTIIVKHSGDIGIVGPYYSFANGTKTFDNVYISFNNKTFTNVYGYLHINDFTASTMSIYDFNINLDIAIHFANCNITDCYYKLENITNNSHMICENTIINLSILNYSISVNTMFYICNIRRLTFDASGKNSIKTLFDNCTVSSLYVYNFDYYYYITAFCNNLTINSIYVKDSNTSGFVNKFHIPASLTSKVHSF